MNTLLNSIYLSLTDVNECSSEYGNFGQCGENAICANTKGSFSCQCPPGFAGSPFSRCQGMNRFLTIET